MKRDAQKALLAAAGRYIRRQFSELEPRLKALESRPSPLKGEQGEPGLDGKDGRDGKSVTLDEVRAYLDAGLATWALDFERRAHDILQREVARMERPKDGIDGKDGRDGLGVEDFDISIDGRDLTVTITRGDFTKSRTLRIPAILDAGVFKDGDEYEQGDAVSFGGSLWIARKDLPQGRPGMSDDWRLAVKKGRDGKGGG